MKTNDLILQTGTKAVAFVILAFSVYIFIAGHHEPGGGFIGGLMTSAALVLLYIAFDVETIHPVLPVNFRIMAAIGVLIAFLSSLGAVAFEEPFLKQAFDYFYLPILGKTELATATIFDLGVYLVVIGVTMTVILSIGEDR